MRSVLVLQHPLIQHGVIFRKPQIYNYSYDEDLTNSNLQLDHEINISITYSSLT